MNFDNYLLSSVTPGIQVAYGLEDVGFSSIRTRVAQLIRAVPDKAIEELNWKKIVGTILLKAKYSFLKKLEKGQPISTGEEILRLCKEIEAETKDSVLSRNFLTTSLNPFAVLYLLEKLIKAINALQENDVVEYKSQYGNVRLTKGQRIDMPRILQELAMEKLENTTTEILKVKKIRSSQ